MMNETNSFQSWLDNEPTPATWSNIIDVIGGPLQNKSLANKICQYLGKDSSMPLIYYYNMLLHVILSKTNPLCKCFKIVRCTPNVITLVSVCYKQY